MEKGWCELLSHQPFSICEQPLVDAKANGNQPDAIFGATEQCPGRSTVGDALQTLLIPCANERLTKVNVQATSHAVINLIEVTAINGIRAHAEIAIRVDVRIQQVRHVRTRLKLDRLPQLKCSQHGQLGVVKFEGVSTIETQDVVIGRCSLSHVEQFGLNGKKLAHWNLGEHPGVEADPLVLVADTLPVVEQGTCV